MLLVKTEVAPSLIQGKGVFAEEFIPKGSVVWQFVPGKDLALTREEVEHLPEPERSDILSLFHSYISKQTGRYISFGDDSGFINHSDRANVGTRYEDGVEEDINFAVRDIQPGEEITIDYRDFAEEGVDF
jgi:uncharacterized protein